MYPKIMLNQVFHKLGCENTSLSVGKLFVIDSHSFLCGEIYVKLVPL